MGEGFSPESHSIVFSIQLLVGIAYLTFWIYLIRIWYKYDKAIFRLFLIILFNVLYTWYYYSFAKKNGWLNKNADEFEKAVQ